MHPWWLVLAGLGAAILGLSIHAARHEVIGPRERAVFHAINGLPDALYPVLWGPMQLGNLVVGTLAGLVVAAVVGNRAIAVGVVLAAVLKLVGERVLRHEVADYLAVRQRPGTSQEHPILRGRDVPVAGASFPSGHAILVAAIAALLAPAVGVEWWWIPFLLTALVMLGRVYVGAHNPLDVVSGFGLGLVLGGAVAVFIG